MTRRQKKLIALLMGTGVLLFGVSACNGSEEVGEENFNASTDEFSSYIKEGKYGAEPTTVTRLGQTIFTINWPWFNARADIPFSHDSDPDALCNLLLPGSHFLGGDGSLELWVWENEIAAKIDSVGKLTQIKTTVRMGRIASITCEKASTPSPSPKKKDGYRCTDNGECQSANCVTGYYYLTGKPIKLCCPAGTCSYGDSAGGHCIAIGQSAPENRECVWENGVATLKVKAAPIPGPKKTGDICSKHRECQSLFCATGYDCRVQEPINLCCPPKTCAYVDASSHCIPVGSLAPHSRECVEENGVAVLKYVPDSFSPLPVSPGSTPDLFSCTKHLECSSLNCVTGPHLLLGMPFSICCPYGTCSYVDGRGHCIAVGELTPDGFECTLENGQFMLRK